MNKTFQAWHDSGLVWLPEKGMGYYPVAASDEPYDAAYFKRYGEMSETPLGKALTAARVSLVGDYWGADLVDVGIGSGAFVSHRNSEISPPFKTYGYDVNPCAIDYLKARGLWRDPTGEQVDAVTFWDSLEHIPDPAEILARVRCRVFASVPIFTSASHVIRSKHFRKTEHRWYWTREGLVAWMGDHGWRLLTQNRMESELGREDIGTFVFARNV